MADISKEIQNFRSARKGKDVRGSMISLAEKVNRETTDASQAAANSSASAGAAASNAQLAVTRADTAVQNANQAAQDIQDKADAGDFTGTIQIGTVTTGEPGSGASVSNSGTAKDAVLDITIPRGKQGVSFRMREAWKPDTDYVNDTSYIDIVSYNGSTYGCLLSHQSSELVTPKNTGYWQCLAQKGETGSIDNIDDVKIGFVEAENRVNISPEDTLAIILGKVEKIYADLKSVAFSGKYSDLSGTLENVSELENDAGYVTTDTWKANTAVSEGYVPATGGIANGIYGTDDKGNPVWKEGFDIDIDVKPDFTGTLDELYAAMEDGSAPVDTIAFVENDTEFESDDFLLPEDRVLVTGSDGVYPSETTAQELEYLSGVTGNVQGQIDEMKSVINIPTNDFFESVAEGVVIEAITIKLCGNIVSMYGYFRINSGPNQPIFTIAEKYRGILPYNIFSIRQGNDPFSEKATAFLQSSSGAVTVYFGNNYVASRYYINSMYAI